MRSARDVTVLSRRRFLAALSVTAVGPALWASVLSDGRASSVAFIDDLGPPDENGIRLPPGFAARLLARSGDPVVGTAYAWHEAPDGGGVAARPSGAGWSYVSNSEVSGGRGGVSVIDFDASGEVLAARSVLVGSERNCAGGMTPWGTWLTCEEVEFGRVFEVDPFGPSTAGPSGTRPSLGSFRHEAAAVDPMSGDVYLTEDATVGRLYRFASTEPGQLEQGALLAAWSSIEPSAMVVGQEAQVSWVSVVADAPDRSPGTSAFDGGEGAWISDGRLLFTTKGDARVWSLDLDSQVLSVVHDCIAVPDTPLSHVDNVTTHPTTGDIYVAEDGGDMQLCLLRARHGDVEIRAALQIAGQDGSEITGPAFSPDGRRLYFSSQRGDDGRGQTFEIVGPFDSERPGGVAPSRGLQPAVRNPAG
jgi:secreted PhoX family phosphatase